MQTFTKKQRDSISKGLETLFQFFPKNSYKELFTEISEIFIHNKRELLDDPNLKTTFNLILRQIPQGYWKIKLTDIYPVPSPEYFWNEEEVKERIKLYEERGTGYITYTLINSRPEDEDYYVTSKVDLIDGEVFIDHYPGEFPYQPDYQIDPGEDWI